MKKYVRKWKKTEENLKLIFVFYLLWSQYTIMKATGRRNFDSMHGNFKLVISKFGEILAIDFYEKFKNQLEMYSYCEFHINIRNSRNFFFIGELR